MTNEELLKSISGMLKTHEDYLSENPEIFYGIQERLLNAIGYEDLEKAEDDDKPKVSRSGYRDWQPKKDHEYTPEQLEAIKGHLDEGYSHREAERFANAHDAPSDFFSALSSKINPSQPSDKYMDMARELALNYKKRAAEREGETAEAERSPQKFASHRDVKAHQEAYGDYHKDYHEFLSQLDEQDLHPLEYDEAVSEWEKDWHEKNPGAREKMAESAEGGKVFQEAKESRAAKRKAGEQDILTAAASGGGETTVGEFSEEAAGAGDIDPSMQTAAQMVGGAKGEGGYEAGTVKSPAAIFAEQNPEYVASLREKLGNRLSQNPEAKERHDAMPTRDRQPKPAPVKTLTPEEIQAQYGDKYKISKPKGGE